MDDSLFDFEDRPDLPLPTVPVVTPDEVGSAIGDDVVGGIEPTATSASSWREVPAALFLSWSAARQFAYCAARDEDSARQADTEIEAEWFRSRARSYKETACHQR